MKVAVSGINGFVGAHLTRELVEHGHEVVGWGLGPLAPSLAALVVSYTEQDLAEGWEVGDVDAVVHLAGLSAVGPSFADPQRYLQVNSAPVTHLAEGLLAAGRAPRLVVVSTGAVYAPGVDVTEQSPTQASSPYVVSKLLVESQCAYYRRRGLDLTVVRPFNHIGPGQGPGFLLPDLIAGVLSGSVVVGNLDTRRDYTDVRDVARAYRLAVEAEQIGAPVLNVCSGTSVSGHGLLTAVTETLRVEAPPIRVDTTRLRPDDPPEIRGSHHLLTRLLGWQPEVDLRQTVEDTVRARRSRPLSPRQAPGSG